MQGDESRRERVSQSARLDLARRLGVSVDDVTVVSVEAVRWTDAALGCPEPGKVYAQVLVDGYRLVLDCAGRRYEYRSDGRRVRLCERD